MIGMRGGMLCGWPLTFSALLGDCSTDRDRMPPKKELHSAPQVGLAVQIKLMGTREQAAEKDFSGIPLEEEVEESLKESAVISMGTEISEMDLEKHRRPV